MTTHAGMDVGKEENIHLSTAGAGYNWCTTVKIGVEIPQRAGNRSTIGSSYITLEQKPKTSIA